MMLSRFVTIVALMVTTTGCGLPSGGSSAAALDATGEASTDLDSALLDAAYPAEGGMPLADGGDDATDSAEGATPLGWCSMGWSSSLAGVTIEFRAPVTCTFSVAQAAAGITIPYDVVVANDVFDVIPAPLDAGGCGQPGSSGLIVLEQLAGAGQSYCLCDTGLCAPNPQPATMLHAGRYGAAFSWDGRNWNGPSDTGSPKGAAFPPGAYSLTVRAAGTQRSSRFAVSATLAIRLIP
jgi:hypothetical protein